MDIHMGMDTCDNNLETTSDHKACPCPTATATATTATVTATALADTRISSAATVNVNSDCRVAVAVATVAATLVPPAVIARTAVSTKRPKIAGSRAASHPATRYPSAGDCAGEEAGSRSDR